jgi:hypothetical protein
MRNGLETRYGVGGKGMFGTVILGCPSLAAPNLWCPIESHWGYVLLLFFGIPVGIEKRAADALCKL